MKPCPYCAELIQDQAVKCRYCGEWLDPSKRPAWSGTPVPAAQSPAIPADPGIAGDESASPESPTAATLPVGSGLPEMPEPERSWSAPAWLANAQRQEDAELEPDPEPEPEASPAPTDHATLEEVALRMERIRQSAAAMRQAPEAEPPRARATRPTQPRAELEVEPGVTLPAGSLRGVDLDGHPAAQRARPPQRPVAAAPRPAPVIRDDEDDFDDEDYEDEPPRRRQRRRREEPVEVAPSGRAMPDAPRERSRADTEPALEARGQRRGRRVRPPAPAPEPVDDFLDDEDEAPESPRRRKRRREPEVVAPPPEPPAEYDDFDEEEDDFDEPPPRRARGDADGFDDDFLDDEDDYGDDDFGDDDFGDMGPAPQPLPWKPIAIGAVVVALALGFLFRDSLFPGDGEDSEAAEAGETDGGTDGEQTVDAKADGEAPPEAEADGEGQPVEPEAAAEGGEAVAAGAEGGEAAAPPQPAALDPETLAKLEEARKGYKDANGNAKKLDAVGATLQEILAKAPEHPDALTLMAQVYLEREKMDEALAMANRCTAVAADSADCWLTIGVIQETKGEKETAGAAYQKYLDLAPEGQYAKGAKAALSRLK